MILALALVSSAKYSRALDSDDWDDIDDYDEVWREILGDFEVQEELVTEDAGIDEDSGDIDETSDYYSVVDFDDWDEAVVSDFDDFDDSDEQAAAAATIPDAESMPTSGTVNHRRPRPKAARVSTGLQSAVNRPSWQRFSRPQDFRPNW